MGNKEVKRGWYQLMLRTPSTGRRNAQAIATDRFEIHVRDLIRAGTEGTQALLCDAILCSADDLCIPRGLSQLGRCAMPGPLRATVGP